MNEPLETKGPLYIYSQQKRSVYKVHCWHTCMSAVAESRVRIPAPCKYFKKQALAAASSAAAIAAAAESEAAKNRKKV